MKNILLNENVNTAVIKPEVKPLVSVLNTQFRELNDREKKLYGVNAGYVIEKATNSPLIRAGIRVGYVITSIGGEEDITLNSLLSLEKTRGRIIIEGFYPTDSKLSYYIIVL